MRNQITGAIWAGCGVWGTLHIMGSYLRDPTLPPLPVLLLTLIVFLVWMAFTWVLGHSARRVMWLIRS